MRKFLFIFCYAILLMITGCSSVNLANTVAGGQNGAVNYCVKVLGNEFLCVEAERTGDKEPEEVQN